MSGYLHLDGWAGRSKHLVIIVGETKTRFRIRSLVRLKLPRRWLEIGEYALVPKHSVTVIA